MKKFIISLLMGILLTMSGFSQHYEYTANSFVQYFDDNTLDEAGIFAWTVSYAGPTFTINETDEIMTITRLFQNWQEAKLNFYDGNLDIGYEPYVCFEAKVSEELDTNTLAIQLVDGDGNFTSTQNVIQLTTEWKVYKVYFHPGGMFASTDPTNIRSMSFHRMNYGEQLSANLMLRTGISIGDTSAISFGTTQYTLDVVADPTYGGSISTDPEAEEYDSGTVVTVTATPYPNYVFNGWTGDDTTASDTSITVTMDANKSITANFTSDASVNDNVLPDLVNVYPNPADDVLSISGLEGSSSAIISDLTGKVLIELQGDDINEIDISDLTSGMYILTCSNDKGILNKTFIKK